MKSLFSFVLRLLLLVAALVFAISLALAAVLVLVLWGLRFLWAKLTGRPISPLGPHLDPRGGFGRVYRRGAAPASERSATGPAGFHDVTDVEPKGPRA